MKNIILLIASFISINLYSQDLGLDWVRTSGGSDDDRGYSVTTDIYGDVLVAGFFLDEVEFGPGSGQTNIDAGSSKDVFIKKLNNEGELEWVKSIGNSNDVFVFDLETDNYGNIYLTGDFKGVLDFDPGSNEHLLNGSSTRDAFILKLNVDGDFIWAKQISSSYNSKSKGQSINIRNNTIYITGLFEGTADFDPGLDTLSISTSEKGIFVLKLNTNGIFEWVRTCTSEIIFRIFSELDANGNIYITGKHNTLHFDQGNEIFNLENNGSFVFKMNEDGSAIWSKEFEGSLILPQGIISDESNNVFVTGYFDGIVDFDLDSDEGILTSWDSYKDAFLVKLNTEGEFEWVKHIATGQGSQSALSLEIDADANIYIIGLFNDTSDFDPGPGVSILIPNGEADIFIQKLNPDGDLTWAKGIGGTYSDYGQSIHINQNSDILATGFFSDTVSFSFGLDSIIAISNGNRDIFTLKLIQDSCSSLGISFDYVNNISCNDVGSASCEAFGGYPPYTYSWDTEPVMIDPEIEGIEDDGIYTVTVIDSIGCVRSSSALMEGPPFIEDFEVDANLVAESFRPGNVSTVIIDAINNGCVMTDGSVSLVLDPLLNVFNYTDQPDLILEDTLIWNYENISYDTDNIVLELDVVTLGLATIGDTICFDLSISPLNGDADSTNNFKHYCFPVLNGYDPNDKQVYPQGICDGHFVLKTDPLTYTIRFQNTGNAEAINIHIMDSLSSYLDINTVEILGSSHDMYTLIRPGNVLDFMFDDIWLPDSTSNEPESHGYVIYKVHPNSFIYNGTYVDNKAEIYFDYNPPIVTNTVFNTLVNELLTCDVGMGVNEEYSNVNDVLIYPNPSEGQINIDFKSNVNNDIKVFNLSGQLVFSELNIIARYHSFQLDEPSGIYIIEINNSNDRQYYKVILE